LKGHKRRRPIVVGTEGSVNSGDRSSKRKRSRQEDCPPSVDAFRRCSATMAGRRWPKNPNPCRQGPWWKNAEGTVCPCLSRRDAVARVGNEFDGPSASKCWPAWKRRFRVGGIFQSSAALSMRFTITLRRTRAGPPDCRRFSARAVLEQRCHPATCQYDTSNPLR